MWAAISYTGRTALVHKQGTLTAQRYIDELIQPHMVSKMQHAGAVFLHTYILLV